MGLITSGLLGVYGSPTVAGIIAGTTIIGVVYAFVLGKRKVDNREDDLKDLDDSKK